MRVVLFGLGPIGVDLGVCAIAQGHTLVGAIDIDPSKTGLGLDELIDGAPSNTQVVADIAYVSDDADVVLHATGSSLGAVAPQLRACLARGLDVVSTCEELAYPWRRHAALAGELDAAARATGMSLVGAGINPGFAMDAFALAVSAPCWSVRGVYIERVLDPSGRRLPLQKKIGLGRSEREFREGVAAGTIGHVGLPESAWFLADRLGLDGVELIEEIEPLIARSRLETRFLSIEPGGAAGLCQRATVRNSGEVEVVQLELTMQVAARDPHDVVRLDADPPLQVLCPGGFPGDTSTAGVVLNVAARVTGAPSGLLTVADLPPPHPRRGDVVKGDKP
jgi:4-hydroxy-tetrahydrodipicolinate reductase